MVGEALNLSVRTVVVWCRDLEGDAPGFESVLAVLDDITPAVEVMRVGVCAFVARGPARYFGGEVALADLIVARIASSIEAMAGATNGVRVGIADGPFSAWLAARSAAPIHIVDPSCSAEFLAALPITVLQNRELVEVLARLGLGTLGAFAALKPADVLARFGNEGLRAQRLAQGLDDHVPKGKLPSTDWSVACEIDPPAQRVDKVAFHARSLATELVHNLESQGLCCVRVAIAADTEHGESMLRVWRCEGTFSAAAVAERLRWQLDGWLSGRVGGSRQRPTAGVSRVVLTPQEVVAAGQSQVDFWGTGNMSDNDCQAVRVAARLQGQLGVEAVRVPVTAGGRHYREQLKLVPAADVELLGRSFSVSKSTNTANGSANGDAPWPGSLPSPAPAQVLSSPCAVEVLDVAGEVVVVSGRGVLSAKPYALVLNSQRFEVVAWAGPWPIHERWWDARRHRRQVRLQLLTTDGLARLVVREAHQWSIVAVWD